jgi:hypothetical protein
MTAGHTGETARGAPPPQRVCPHCARVAYATERRCPYCRRRYRRRTLPAIAAMLLVFAAVILGGVYFMLVSAGDRIEDRVDEQIEGAQRDFDRSLDDFERRMQQELERRAGEAPSPTPAPTETPTPTPTPTPFRTPTPTP